MSYKIRFLMLIFVCIVACLIFSNIVTYLVSFIHHNGVKILISVVVDIAFGLYIGKIAGRKMLYYFLKDYYIFEEKYNKQTLFHFYNNCIK